MTEAECYFISSLFRVDLSWSNVKRIHLETQQVKGVPTSVLVVVLQRNETMSVQTSSGALKKKKGSSSKKYIFYGFQDLLGAEEQINHYLELYRSSAKAKGEEAPCDVDTGSSGTSKVEKRDDNDEVSSTGSNAHKEESVKSSLRLSMVRKAESESKRTALRQSLPGRRAETVSGTSSKSRQNGVLTAAGATPTSPSPPSFLNEIFEVIFRCVVVGLLASLFVLMGYRAVQRFKVTYRTPLQEAELLLRDLSVTEEQVNQQEEYYSHNDFQQHNRERKEMTRMGHSWISRLEESAAALMNHYVAQQSKMASLRGRRENRLVQEVETRCFSDFCETAHGSAPHGTSPSFLLNATISYVAKGPVTFSHDVSEVPLTLEHQKISGNHASTPRKRKKFSIHRMLDDLRLWRSRIRAVYHAISSWTQPWKKSTSDAALLKGSLLSSKAEGLVLYEEPVDGGFTLVESVPAEEAADREECLAISLELLKVVEMMEVLFAKYSRLFLFGSYHRLGSGEEKGYSWARPPEVLLSSTSSIRKFLSSELAGSDVAHVALLRRYASSLIYSDPLIANQAERRATALNFSEDVLSFRRQQLAWKNAADEVHLEDVLEMWTAFDEMILEPSRQASEFSSPPVQVLRNSIEELHFWHRNSPAWTEHILASFSSEEQEVIRSAIPWASGSLRPERDDEGGDVHLAWATWVDLPIFRGLLCFSRYPTLVRHGSVATVDSADGEEEELSEVKQTGASPSPVDDDPNLTKAYGDALVSNTSKMVVTPVTAPPPDAVKPPANPIEEFPPSSARFHTNRKDNRLQVGTEWKEVKVRWMTDLEVFRLTFSSVQGASTLLGELGQRRSYRMDDEDIALVAEAAMVRERLFRIISFVNSNYMRHLTPSISRRLHRKISSLFHPFGSHTKDSDIYVQSVKSWGTQGPAVQLATTQVSGWSSGSSRDVSRSLLYLLLEPPSLLQISATIAHQCFSAVVVFTVFAVALGVVYVVY